MRFVTLIAAAISVLAFASQSASALQVQDSYRGSNELSKRRLPGAAAAGGASAGTIVAGAVDTVDTVDKLPDSAFGGKTPGGKN
jgi:hypothetical protein